MVDMPSGETPNIAHPSTFGYGEDVGPFDSREEAQEFLDTGSLRVTKKQIEMNGETYLVEWRDRDFRVSKKNGKLDLEEIILVMREAGLK
ncbi:MAG: hypothetical protein WB630_14155 [Candidatus Acidiferrales bacterium]